MHSVNCKYVALKGEIPDKCFVPISSTINWLQNHINRLTKEFKERPIGIHMTNVSMYIYTCSR